MSYDSIEIFENESHHDRTNEDVILLKIICYDGRFVSLELLTTMTIEEVKCQALTELVLPISNEHGTCVLNYKLLKSTGVMLDLNESLSISENHLSDHGKK